MRGSARADVLRSAGISPAKINFKVILRARRKILRCCGRPVVTGVGGGDAGPGIPSPRPRRTWTVHGQSGPPRAKSPQISWGFARAKCDIVSHARRPGRVAATEA